MTAEAVHRAIHAVWRIESARLIAGLTRLVRDVGLAEEAARDALVSALERWPQPEVHGLVALIGRGLAALARAEAARTARGPYTLQAAIAACHARARTAEQTDWVRICELYAQLADLTGSPVVELNRAVALARREALSGEIGHFRFSLFMLRSAVKGVIP